MNRIIFLLFLTLTLFSCNQKEIDKIEIDASLYITKTEVGFNIYSNKRILILEYTEQNCDSLSLKTLDEIFQTAKELYNQEPDKEKEFQSIKSIIG